MYIFNYKKLILKLLVISGLILDDCNICIFLLLVSIGTTVSDGIDFTILVIVLFSSFKLSSSLSLDIDKSL